MSISRSTKERAGLMRLTSEQKAIIGTIKRAFRKLRATAHPDKNLGNFEDAQTAFKQINNAYEEILKLPSDPAPSHFTAQASPSAYYQKPNVSNMKETADNIDPFLETMKWPLDQREEFHILAVTKPGLLRLSNKFTCLDWNLLFEAISLYVSRAHPAFDSDQRDDHIDKILTLVNDPLYSIFQNHVIKQIQNGQTKELSLDTIIRHFNAIRRQIRASAINENRGWNEILQALKEYVRKLDLSLIDLEQLISSYQHYHYNFHQGKIGYIGFEQLISCSQQYSLYQEKIEYAKHIFAALETGTIARLYLHSKLNYATIGQLSPEQIEALKHPGLLVYLESKSFLENSQFLGFSPNSSISAWPLEHQALLHILNMTKPGFEEACKNFSSQEGEALFLRLDHYLKTPALSSQHSQEPQLDNLIDTFLAYTNSTLNSQLQHAIIDKIQAEIERLKPHASSKAGQAKITILNTALKEINSIIIGDNDKLRSSFENIQSYQTEVYKQISETLKKYASSKTICRHRNTLASFFKGLLGVLLGLASAGILFANSQFRSMFFKTKSQAALDESCKWLENHTPQEIQRNRKKNR